MRRKAVIVALEAAHGVLTEEASFSMRADARKVMVDLVAGFRGLAAERGWKYNDIESNARLRRGSE